MLAAIILLLIKIAVVALVIYLIIWVLGQLGISLPPRVEQILWVICVLIVLYVLVTEMVPMLGGGRAFRL